MKKRDFYGLVCVCGAAVNTNVKQVYMDFLLDHRLHTRERTNLEFNSNPVPKPGYVHLNCPFNCKCKGRSSSGYVSRG